MVKKKIKVKRRTKPKQDPFSIPKDPLKDNFLAKAYARLNR